MAKKKKPKSKEVVQEEVKQNYFGSVRFFKHLILSVIGLAIITPTVILIIIINTEEKDTGLIPREVLEQGNIGARGTVLTPENFEDMLAETPDPEDLTYIVSMNMEWVFDKWDVPSRAVSVDNYVDNTRTVYIDVFLEDENGDIDFDELIYSSPYIPVGVELTNFALQKPVSAGVHPATVVYHLVDDDYNLLTDLSVGIRLIIKN